mgnify:CR=1 FL=1
MMMKLLDRKIRFLPKNLSVRRLRFWQSSIRGFAEVGQDDQYESVDDLPSELTEDESVKRIREVNELT